MVNRLLDYIEDDSQRREYEQRVQRAISKHDDLTILTNVYENEEIMKHILQLSTYNDQKELYGGEVVLPESEDDEKSEFFDAEIDHMLCSMEEAMEDDRKI